MIKQLSINLRKLEDVRYLVCHMNKGSRQSKIKFRSGVNKFENIKYDHYQAKIASLLIFSGDWQHCIAIVFSDANLALFGVDLMRKQTFALN